ncbi:MAG: potassium/proton antiporter [Hydrogenophaga sp.]|uniref:potassium/proton antiporter n=1 Tax=Hydrogenophaga sp. TaxID=1904254 RepID=UPI001BBB8EFB|nr:potassium/proton antiporter [Hydrogenophaga sp.]MBS3910598.1 potassium/proton antiporter [Hydrogenophaga sp.]MDO9149182.1 potassium/proton antiporter [Hydrogenophaga sp.]MDO9606152.1 potassium/proton antiporter [Hydrogenophaga sp.]MDP2163886.1 potassium/proton antiporter [Hydrogenophaga sp.]MDP3476072.1 potassium/proton antiporter [Hydrogenophaga sp.]
MALSLDFLTLPLLAAAALVFISVLAGVFSARIGFSFLLVFLVVGTLAGVDGPGGLVFNDFRLSFWVGNVALAVILLDGGLRTNMSTFRTGLRPSLLLATVGVVVCTAITGAAAYWLLDLSWPLALLVGAIVGSTDAAAVFSLLKSSGVQLNERVAATLEIESGMNDPMAVYLTLTFIAIALAVAGGSAEAMGAGDVLLSLLRQFGWGTLLGLGCGWGLAELMKRLGRRADGGGGIRALLMVSGGLAVFAFTTWFGGSGFLAVYIMGVVVGNRARRQVRPSLSAMDGYAWLSQAGMFLLLGLLVTPSGLLRTLWPALGVSLVLMFVARPISVWLCLAPLRFSRREMTFISWVGLRGAVPIVLAVFPLMAGVPGAQTFFNVAFVVVLTSLLLQGSTIAWSAKRTGVTIPDPDDTEHARLVLGDFVLDASTPMESLCAFYGLPVPDESTQSVGDWLQSKLNRPPVPGDSVLLGSAEISVRDMKGRRIGHVGIKLG